MQRILLCMLIVACFFSKRAFAKDSELKNLALNRPYDVTASWPDEYFEGLQKNYPDSGARELTDGKFGSLVFQDKEYQNFLRQGGRTITVDLGEVKTVKEITGHFLQYHAAGIYVPRYLDYYLSLDGTEWEYFGEIKTKVGTENLVNQKEQFTLPGLNHLARYVKIQFPTDVNVFMDELEVFGYDKKVAGAYELRLAIQSEEFLWQKSAVIGKDLPPKGYLEKGLEDAAGAEHVALLIYAYPPSSGEGTWSSYEYVPYVSYITEEGVPQDWMFDTVLLCPQGSTSTARKLYASEKKQASTIEDWRWYVEETFKPEKQLAALDRAVGTAKGILGDSEHRVKVILSLVTPSPFQNDFGAVEVGEESLNFDQNEVGAKKAFANRVTAISWLIDQLKGGFEKLAPENLELIGFYWQPETIIYHQSMDDGKFVKEVSELVHSEELKFFWIPFYGAAGSYDWHNYGFDAVMLQPNYMFTDAKESRVKMAAELAFHLGMGIEMEKHWLNTALERGKWSDYLNGGVKYGYINAVVGYYQGFKDLSRASMNYNNRTLFYDYVYQFIKGSYSFED